MSKPLPQFKVVPLELVSEIPPDKKNPKRFSSWLAFLLGFAAILFIGAGGYWWLSNQRSKTPESANKTSRETISAPTPVPYLTWDDPAGFTFSYPEDLTINKHEEDQENYAHVELTHSLHPGKMIIWAKDLPLTDIKVTIKDAEEWGTSDRSLSKGNAVDTLLGGEPAKKILLTGLPEKTLMGVVYDEALWVVEVEYNDKLFWASVYKTVTDTFKFKPPLNATTTSNNDSADVAVDEEEVIE